MIHLRLIGLGKVLLLVYVVESFKILIFHFLAALSSLLIDPLSV
jgi:hypothetical protein